MEENKYPHMICFAMCEDQNGTQYLCWTDPGNVCEGDVVLLENSNNFCRIVNIADYVSSSFVPVVESYMSVYEISEIFRKV